MVRAVLHWILALFLPSGQASVESCRLSANQVLTLAYTTPVSNRIRTRILRAASKRNYYVHFASLKSTNNPLEVDAIITPGGHDIDIDLYLSKIPGPERAKELVEFKKEAHRGRN